MVRRICIAWGICYLVFVLVPVMGPRLLYPDFQVDRIGNGPFSAIARLNQDEGMLRGAAFPSAHLAATAVATWSSRCWRKALFWSVLPVAASIAFGAVYLGYHYITDVVAGVLVAVVAVLTDRTIVGNGWRTASTVLEEPVR
jgi:membrane-associated phospholipid phosphatase